MSMTEKCVLKVVISREQVLDLAEENLDGGRIDLEPFAFENEFQIKNEN